ncbi:MAG: START domain-containing protein [Crocinitomicaceae bacterium]|nr:START domain-containing protein [Crocinitomicaceae bacterium]
MKYTVLFLGFLLLSFTPKSEWITPAEEPWKLAKNKDGVLVYTRQPEGKKIKEFKAIVKIKTNMQKIIDLIEDVEKYPEWQSDITSSKTLKKISTTERYIYYALDVPWPITDRDVVTHVKKTSYTSGQVIFKLTSKPDYIKEKEGFIRIKDAQGSWKLTPKENGYIEVIYQSYGDPAGSIPSGIINSFIVDGPFKTMSNMRTKCQ